MNEQMLLRQIAQLESRLSALERQTGKQPLRPALGGGNDSSGHGVWVASSYTALVAMTGPIDGDFGFTSDTKRHWGLRNGTWRILQPWLSESSPGTGSPVNFGDLWLIGSTNRMHWFDGAVWQPLPYVSSAKVYCNNGSTDLLLSHFE